MASAAVLPAPTHVRMEDPGRQPPPVQDKAGPTAEEFAALQRELGEVKESARVWEGIANNRPQPQRPAAEETHEPSDAGIDWGKDEDIASESDDVTAEALLDDLSKSGLKALQKHGFVRKSDVVRIAREESRKAAATASTQVVNRARTEVTTEARQAQILKDEFPELSDTKSELYKITVRNLQEAVALDPGAAKSGAALILSARAARAELGGKAPTRGQQADDDDVPAPRRTAREEHIAAQSGDRGRGTRSTVDTGRDTDGPGLSEDELMVANALGVDPKSYKTNKVALNKQTSARGRR